MVKKRIVGIMAALAAIMMMLASCGNYQLIDTTFTFKSAIISLPDGSILRGEVTSWKDYEDGDQIQVTINGKTYLCHSSDVVLISE